MNDEIETKRPEGHSAMLRLINRLQKHGFNTTPYNPFHVWIKQNSSSEISTDQAEADKIYVTDLGIPPIVPFDSAFIEIRITHFERDYFYLALNICFYRVMEGLLEADEFREVMTEHDVSWMRQLVSLFQPAEMEFSLKWDTEHDLTIEDTLYGYFPLTDIDKVIAVVGSIKACVGTKGAS